MSLLFLIAAALLFAWSFRPENRALPALAAVAGVWLAVFFLIFCFRLKKRLLRPTLEAEAFAARLVRGEFPAPIAADGRRNCCPDLPRSLNLLRDQLQHISVRLYGTPQQGGSLRGSRRNSELRSRILTDLASDLRIPLNTLRGYTCLLRETPDSPHRQTYLAALDRGVIAAEAVVNRLIGIGRLTSRGEEPPERAPFDTAAFLRQLTEQNAPFLNNRDVRLIHRYQADAPRVICGDRGELAQMLTILIRSLGTSAAPGGTVELGCGRQNGEVVFTLRDAGGPADGEPLVRRFERCGGSDLPAGRESLPLLGLLFLETQAAVVNGTLSVRPCGPAGTEVALRLAEADGERQPAAPSASRISGSTEPPREAGGEERDPERLLLVDSDREFATLLGCLFPHCAITVHRGLNHLPQQLDLAGYDAALLALAPGWGDGDSAALGRLLNAAAARQLPVVAVLSDRSAELARVLERGGVHRIRYKPLDFARLREELRGLRHTGAQP